MDVSFVYMASDLHNLIIVESPSKAKTLKRFLGNDYQIEASVGHIRDLPKNDLGVDIENGFKPTYVASEDKSKVISQLKSLINKDHSSGEITKFTLRLTSLKNALKRL